MKLIKVKDSINLHREIDSGAIVNTSTEDYNRYLKQKESAMSQKNRIEKLENDIADIKVLLNAIVDKL